jgi:hypothetical protein
MDGEESLDQFPQRETKRNYLIGNKIAICPNKRATRHDTLFLLFRISLSGGL